MTNLREFTKAVANADLVIVTGMGGIALDRVMTTGDDAIEMVYRLRRDSLGDGLGINLRMADYSVLP